MRRFLILLACFTLAITASAQSKPPAAGHWEGVIPVPNHEMKIAVDLDLNGKGEWIGDFDFEPEGMTHFPISNIVVKGNTLKFELAGIPGDPGFDGEISPDGKILAGDFSQDGGAMSTELKWVSAAKVDLPAKSTAIAKEFEGSWESAIPAPDGQNHRAVLKLANGPDGSATGVLLGGEGYQLPVSSIQQTGNQLKLDLRAVGAVFNGELKSGEIVGTWRAGREFPVTFKRAAAK
jgi:hypothetical protein